jgi:hypothetical protein
LCTTSYSKEHPNENTCGTQLLDVNAALALSASVAMHVAWNLMARQQKAATHPLWWVLSAHLVLLAPWGLYHFFLKAELGRQQVLLLAGSVVGKQKKNRPWQ